MASKQGAPSLQPPSQVALRARVFRSVWCAPLSGRHAINLNGGHPMPRKQNREQSVADVIAESPTVKSRAFGTCRFAILRRVAADPALRYTAGGG